MDTKKLLGKPYLPRVIDDRVKRSLKLFGAVIIDGPRGCGKTMTGAHVSNSAVLLDRPESKYMAEVNLEGLLAGERPRLIDEWQLVPDIWNAARRAVDAASEPGQFVFTGSALPADEITRHSGAGRFSRIRQYTMSWFERGIGSPKVSLSALLEGERPKTSNETIEYKDVVNHLCGSGFPQWIGLDASDGLEVSASYLQEATRVDMQRLQNIRHSPAVVMQLLRSLSRVSASATSFATLAKDLQVVAPGISAETIAVYLELLERIFVVERQHAWTVALRSRARLRTGSKWHLADPSLAATLLTGSSAKLADDPNTVGLLFESAVVHDLKVFAQGLGAQVFHYQNSNNRELDAVMEWPDGRWAGVEVKVSGNQIQAAHESLTKAVQEISQPPEFLLIVTGTGPVMTLSDGTISCPLHALHP